MTQSEFLATCMALLIDPAIALESDAVVQALREHCSTKELTEILSTEF